MKKIIKIAALILALLCIGTSFASCGQSKEDLASEIKSGMTLKRETIDYVTPVKVPVMTYTASELFAGKWVNNQVGGFKVALNEIEKTITIEFVAVYHGLTVNNGKTVYTINLPVEIKSTSYGIISEDKKSVIAEYIYDPSVYPGVQHIEPNIIINY